MLLDSSSEVSSVINAEVAASEMEAAALETEVEMATEVEAAKETEGQINSMNSGRIVRAEENK
jgi:hypothetical protein